MDTRTGTNSNIARIELWHLRLPLSQPYHLSFGDLSAFDTILADHGETRDASKFPQ